MSYYYRYLDNVEVFCPNDTCSGVGFPQFPYGVVGSVSAFVLGTAVVCGGAQTTYDSCATQNTAQYCARNAECVTSAGGSIWCTGPKTGACYIYDRYVTRSWVQSPKSLKSKRAYAASVTLPDGRLWILGGANPSQILQTTEFLVMSENAIQSVSPGPDMLEPLMSHSAAWITPTQVLVLGGFSSALNDYTPVANVYDFAAQQWIKKSWISPGPRIDASCLNVDVGGQRRVLLAGGWNNGALTDTGLFSKDDFHWTFYNGTNVNSNPLPFPLRSSVMIERNQVPYLLGGVICAANGRSCKQTNKGNITTCSTLVVSSNTIHSKLNLEENVVFLFFQFAGLKKCPMA
jgi:hypothetical protein